MKHFCDIIPLPLAEKLKAAGMPIDIDCETFDSGTQDQRDEIWCNNTYSEVFDWLMAEKGIIICFDVDMEEKISDTEWDAYILRMAENLIPNCSHLQGYHTWHEAAEKAIEKALTLI